MAFSGQAPSTRTGGLVLFQLEEILVWFVRVFDADSADFMSKALQKVMDTQHRCDLSRKMTGLPNL